MKPDAPRGVMFGFLNVFLAAALHAHGLSDDEAVALLEERDPQHSRSSDDDDCAGAGIALTRRPGASVARSRRVVVRLVLVSRAGRRASRAGAARRDDARRNARSRAALVGRVGERSRRPTFRFRIFRSACFAGAAIAGAAARRRRDRRSDRRSRACADAGFLDADAPSAAAYVVEPNAE